MGETYSTGASNDDLVDYLVKRRFISNDDIERAFRTVDRGDYMLREAAYRDIPWKDDKIHLSAPCLYAAILHGLSLEPGLTFLNIGSGSGYFSTVAGLLLSKNDVSHGVEQNEDCLAFANESLEKFKQKLCELNASDFCEPVFQLGNIFNYASNRQYDRVYCGAECPESHLELVKRFVRIDGILVIPYNGRLLRIKRLSKKKWKTRTMLLVTFDVLVIPEDQQELLELPLYQPKTLQELCRGTIRRQLRKIILAQLKKSNEGFVQRNTDFKMCTDQLANESTSWCDNWESASPNDDTSSDIYEYSNLTESNESNCEQDYLSNNEEEDKEEKEEEDETNEKEINQIINGLNRDDDPFFINSIWDQTNSNFYSSAASKIHDPNLGPCSDNIDTNQNANDESGNDFVADSDSMDSSKRENSGEAESNENQVHDDDSDYEFSNMFESVNNDCSTTIICRELGVPNQSIYTLKNGLFLLDHYESAFKISSKDLLPYMKERISQLPIPYSLRLYINFNREF